MTNLNDEIDRLLDTAIMAGQNPEHHADVVTEARTQFLALISKEVNKGRIDELERAKRNNMITAPLMHRVDRRTNQLKAQLQGEGEESS